MKKMNVSEMRQVEGGILGAIALGVLLGGGTGWIAGKFKGYW